MKKIAMIGQKGMPTLFGGVERHVEEISLRLARKKGYRIFVYVRPYYTIKKTETYRGVRIIHLPSLRTKHLDAISHVFLATLHAIFVLKADVFHYHGIGPALCLWLPKLLRPQAKVIFTYHCRDYFHEKWNFFARVSLRLGEMLGVRFADEVIAVSREIAEYISNQYGRRAQYIPHGTVAVRKRKAQKNLFSKWHLEKGGYFLYVGRLIRHKGVHHLIKAYQRVKTDKRLVIVGAGFFTDDYERELTKLARENPRIILLGSQHGRALEELYRHAYLLIQPSEQEGMPLVLLEAAGFGRPLLLSDISIHREIFSDLPYFFKNKNVASLARGLEYALKHPALNRARAAKIKRYSRRHYDWSRVVESISLKYS